MDILQTIEIIEANRKAIYQAIVTAPRQIRQADIAAQAGVYPATITRFLQDPTQVGIQALAKIHKGLTALGIVVGDEGGK